VGAVAVWGVPGALGTATTSRTFLVLEAVFVPDVIHNTKVARIV
jgi:hypothetical protein